MKTSMSRAELPATARRIAAGETVNIVIYGDSISEVGRTPSYYGGASGTDKNWAQQMKAILIAAMPSARLNVTHFGVGGQNSYEALGRLDWLGPFDPHLVFLEFGANDCGWHAIPPKATATALASLIDNIRARHKAEVVVLGLGADNPQAPAMTHVKATAAAIRKVAKEKAAPWVDVRKAMLRLTGNGTKWGEFHNGFQDCHPNDRGHRAWGETVAARLLLAFNPDLLICGNCHCRHRAI